jgi:Flp pilus assembly protein TadD
MVRNQYPSQFSSKEQQEKLETVLSSIRDQEVQPMDAFPSSKVSPAPEVASARLRKSTATNLSGDKK